LGSTSTGSILDFVEVRFGGANARAAVVVNGSSLSLTDSVIRDSVTHALLAQNSADVQVVNDLIVRNSDAGIRAESLASVTAINNTIDGNFRGLAVDGNGARVELTNSLITNNARAGVAVSSRGTAIVKFSDVFNPGASEGNYFGLPNPTGQNGNVSVDPKYVSRAALDFHLQATSPVIDAATSDGAPVDDLAFNFRTDDPATPNTGAGQSPFLTWVPTNSAVAPEPSSTSRAGRWPAPCRKFC
jgi:hypothetical protein